MDHPVFSPTELVRPWRTATIVATAIAGVELVLLIVVGIVFLGRSLAPHVHAAAERQALAAPAPAVAEARPAEKPKHRAKPVAKLSRAQTAVLVLNGNGVQGAASEAASLVKARGYTVKEVGNAPRTGYARTMVMYRPGFGAEAARFAKDMNLVAVSALDGLKPAKLHGAHLVMLLGASR